MHRNFALFQSHLDLAHAYWQRLMQEGDWAIDATCGAGNDTLKLAEIVLAKNGGGVIGIDLQEEAILRTQELLTTKLATDIDRLVHLFCQSHVDFPRLATQVPIKLIVYNLGYLPRGDKQVTTQTLSTLQSVQKALELVIPGGAISITCYPGHEEGAREEKALMQFVAELPPAMWSVCHHRFANRLQAPSLIFLQKNSAAAI